MSKEKQALPVEVANSGRRDFLVRTSLWSSVTLAWPIAGCGGSDAQDVQGATDKIDRSIQSPNRDSRVSTLSKPNPVNSGNVLFPMSSDPQKIIPLSEIVNYLNKAVLNNSDAAKSDLESLIYGDPLGAVTSIVETLVSNAASSIPVVGGFISVGLGLLFGIFNNLLSKNDPPNPGIEDVIREIAGGMIDQAHFKMMQAKVKGIQDVNADFSFFLRQYVGETNLQTRADLRDEVLRSFTEFRGHVVANLPGFLIPDLNEKRVAGLPFYCHCAGLFVLTLTDLLRNRKTLQLEDDYYKAQLKYLRERIGEWTTTIDAQAKQRYQYILDNTSDSGYETWPKMMEFINTFYSSGYALYISAVKSSAELEAGFSVETRNDVELYAPWKVIGSYYNDMLDWARYRILERPSMMTRIAGYSHIDAVNRLSVQYVTADGTERNMAYEVCSGEVGRDTEKRISSYFYNNPFETENIDGGQVPNNIYSETSFRGSLNELRLQLPNTSISLGSHRDSGDPIQSSTSMPGYYCSGLVIENSQSNGKDCRVDSGVRVGLPVTIFRHASGIEIAQIFRTLDKPQYSCELSLNSGFISTSASSSDGYAEPKTGKNVINSTKNGTEIIFRIYNNGEPLKIKSITPIIFMPIHFGYVKPFDDWILLQYSERIQSAQYLDSFENSEKLRLEVKGFYPWNNGIEKTFYLIELNKFIPQDFIVTDSLDVTVMINSAWAGFASLNLNVEFE